MERHYFKLRRKKKTNIILNQPFDFCCDFFRWIFISFNWFTEKIRVFVIWIKTNIGIHFNGINPSFILAMRILIEYRNQIQCQLQTKETDWFHSNDSRNERFGHCKNHHFPRKLRWWLRNTVTNRKGKSRQFYL